MRAFTLIETLMTVVLLATVAAAGAIGLTGVTEAARLHEAAAIIRATDADARSLAGASGRSVMLMLTEDRRSLQLLVSGEVVLERPLPIAAYLIDPATESSLHVLAFDSAGRTRDYLVAFDSRPSDEPPIRISGLTGWASP